VLPGKSAAKAFLEGGVDLVAGEKEETNPSAQFGSALLSEDHLKRESHGRPPQAGRELREAG
jgi:hypothetical protein